MAKINFKKNKLLEKVYDQKYKQIFIYVYFIMNVSPFRGRARGLSKMISGAAKK